MRENTTPAVKHIGTRALAFAAVFILIGTVGFGDPLWISFVSGIGLGGVFGVTSYLVYRVFSADN